MLSHRVLKSNDRPAGWLVPDLLRCVRLEIEGHGLKESADRGKLLELCGLLLQAEGVALQGEPSLRVVEPESEHRLVPRRF